MNAHSLYPDDVIILKANALSDRLDIGHELVGHIEEYKPEMDLMYAEENELELELKRRGYVNEL